MAHTDSDKSSLQGDISLYLNEQQSFASSQVELLAAIKNCGSISKAAKEVGISYKTAWERIDAMNNMSAQPLVKRTIGGAKGGGTSVTELGLSIIAGFQSLQAEHQKFIEHLGEKLHSLNDLTNFIRNENMKTSARNQLRGQVADITTGSVNVEVALNIGSSQQLYAIITQESCDRLNLAKGSEAVAIIKASAVILSKDTNIATSARNQFVGKVSRVITGAVNTDVTIDIGGDKSLSAIITNKSAENLELKEGDEIVALFKAPSVILLAD